MYLEIELINDNFNDYICVKILDGKPNSMFSFREFPNISRDSPALTLKILKLNAKKCCDKHRGLAPLLVTKFQAFSSNTAGLRPGESPLELGNSKCIWESFRFPC